MDKDLSTTLELKKVCCDENKATVDYCKLRAKKMQETTRQGLQSPRDAPLISGTDAESLNATSLNTGSNVNSPADDSKPLFHSGSGCNTRKSASMSGKHNVFVLDVNGNPLTPTTNAKARKLLEGKQAKPVWSKFSQFGIKMIVNTRSEVPITILGVDFGTKYEGYAVVVDKENGLAVMLKLPNKKEIVRRLAARQKLRRTRRWRNCRGRMERFNNRKVGKTITPSQRVLVQSRLKTIDEFFKCYPVNTVAIEDVKFGHRRMKWGGNFSTIEVGKTMIKKSILQKARLALFSGYDTKGIRSKYGYKKSTRKNAEKFNSHCSDALAIATETHIKKYVEPGKFIVFDDTYRPFRRKLHDTTPSKNGKRDKFVGGDFHGVRKGTICEYGQICGGTGNRFRIRNEGNKRISRTAISWLSHKFKTYEVDASVPVAIT